MAVYSHSPRGPIPQGTNAGSVGLKSPAIASLPPTGLGAFAVGQSDIQLGYVPVNTDSIYRVLQGSELGNPVNLKRGAFDIAFVVIFLLPIFILAISYDMLSSEKERGTLAMVLSHPITLQKLMMSKVISRAAIILVVVLALGVAALFSVGLQLGSLETWGRFVFWLTATLLYSLFWFVLSVFVNAVSRNSSTNGIILAGSWLAFVVVLPTLISILATSVYPAPSRFDFITASRSAQTDAERNYMEALDKYYYDHVEYVPDERVNDFLATSKAKSEAVDKAIAPLFEQFRTQLIRQDDMVSRFQFLSPAIMMQRALNDASGVSNARYDNFVKQVQAFHAEWVSFFTVRFLDGEPLTSSEYAGFPRFEYQEEPFHVVANRIAPSLVGLLLITVAVAAVGFSALQRYQVASR